VDFDVMVMEDQFGDILSDLGAGLVGGLGLGPSAEIGEAHGLFQPSHGIGPQQAGKNVANPMATILSAAKMLDWLGDKHNDPVCTEAAVRFENAVADDLKQEQVRAPDIGGKSSTTDVASAVADALG
jgi:3-isopropylmalate dehydrogenase